MIIKSMARKTASFNQLVNYMEKGKESYKSYETFYRNLYSRNGAGITSEFKTNASQLTERKNGNYLYHEIISLKVNHELSLEEQKEKLYLLVNDYIELRAKRNLVYGVMHTDNKEHLHFHLMISSNEFGSDKRYRLSKSNFAKIQKAIEQNVLNNFPELQQKTIYNKHKDEKTKKEEYELKKRTGKESDRDIVKNKLTAIFNQAKTKAEFFNQLSDNQFEIYVHGNTIGIKSTETGKKYRLKTLGLLDEFNAVSQIIESAETQKQQTSQEAEKINIHTVNKAFSKERIDTRSFHQQQEKTSEPKAEQETKTYTASDTNASNNASEKQETKQNKTNRQSRDENSYNQHKAETHKTHHESDVRKPKWNNENKNQERNQERNKSSDSKKTNKHKKADNYQDTNKYQDKYQQADRKREEKARTAKKKYYQQQEKHQTHVPKTEVELEIERRKQEMKKQRENQADYSKDYSKGK